MQISFPLFPASRMTLMAPIPQTSKKHGDEGFVQTNALIAFRLKMY